jgi:hypothetical protein
MSSSSLSFCRWVSTEIGVLGSNMSPTNLYTCANGRSSAEEDPAHGYFWSRHVVSLSRA